MYAVTVLLSLLFVSQTKGHGTSKVETESVLQCSDSLPVLNESFVLQDACSTMCHVVEVESAYRDDLENVGLAFGLVTLSSLASSVGAAVVFIDRCIKSTELHVLAASLAFAGGVMLFVSFTEVYSESVKAFEECECLWSGEDAAVVMAILAFFGGVLLFVLIDSVHDQVISKFDLRNHPPPEIEKALGEEKEAAVESAEIPPIQQQEEIELSLLDIDVEQQEAHETNIIQECVNSKSAGVESDEAVGEPSVDNRKQALKTSIESTSRDEDLRKTGVLTAVALALHNFPEGLATFAATLSDPRVGVSLAIAITCHNIPEGVSIAVPLYYATGSKCYAFWVASAAGLAEFVGGVFCFVVLRSVVGPLTFAILNGLTAGIMVAVVLGEILPSAFKYDPENKVSSKFVFLGMVFISLSLLLFRV